MNILKPHYHVGVLDIYGIFTDKEEANHFLNDSDYKYFARAAHVVGEPNPMGWYFDTDYLVEGATLRGVTELWVLYGTRNCADNVGYKQLNSIMQCVLDNEDVVTTPIEL